MGKLNWEPAHKLHLDVPVPLEECAHRKHCLKYHSLIKKGNGIHIQGILYFSSKSEQYINYTKPFMPNYYKKSTTTVLSLMLTISYCYCQNNGSITALEARPISNMEVKYSYKPPERLSIPDVIELLVVYQTGKQTFLKKIRVIKEKNRYTFKFKAPDSTAILLLSVADENNQIVDSNNEEGYLVYLHDKKGERYTFGNISLAGILNGYAQFFLKVKKTPAALLIKMYEDTYRINPELKEKDTYLNYLAVLYKEKNDTVKTLLLTYAKKMADAHNDESKWVKARVVYQLLDMDSEISAIDKKAIETYPNGILAKDKFWTKFNSRESLTEGLVLASMDEYEQRFKDTSITKRDFFYTTLISLLLEKNDLASLNKYESLMEDKITIAKLYNNFVYKLTGEHIDSVKGDLQVAKSLSKKAFDLMNQKIKTLPENDQQKKELLHTLNRFTDTYAMILYKNGQYDSAFYYQDLIYKKENELSTGGLERYVIYAEKIKGAAYTKNIIEQQLLNGLNSPGMATQLQSIYKQLQLPENEFNTLKEKSDLLTKQKTSAAIKAKFGTTKANEFVLKNLSGQNVSLSSFKNKVVVIDFWATWCVPCRASFPAMQELVNKYKNDSSVVFLFIDVWENKSAQKMQETAMKLMTEGNYSFNVLLDTRDKVVDNFKVDAIPAKFIIDKTGEIVFMGETSDIALEIEKAKN